MHTEGWLNAYDVNYSGFTNIWSIGDNALLRKSGWESMNRLWIRLNALKINDAEKSHSSY